MCNSQPRLKSENHVLWMCSFSSYSQKAQKPKKDCKKKVLTCGLVDFFFFFPHEVAGSNF